MNAVTQTSNQDFKLKNFTIEYIDWGDLKGKYKANIKFANNEYDSFSTSLPEEVSLRIVALILATTQKAASSAIQGILTQLEDSLNEQNTITMEQADVQIGAAS